jgi:hypothetical protein
MTLHDFFGPRLMPVHASAVFEKADEPVTEIFSADVALVPELVTLNACDALLPAAALTAPKLKVAGGLLVIGDQLSAGPPAACAESSANSKPTAAATRTNTLARLDI